ncbi:hypothetical protein BH10CYA1_BH10CYA1_39220 [soil metagenome]
MGLPGLMLEGDNVMKNMELLAIVLLVIGGINWGLVGAFNYNLVTSLLGDGSTMTRVVYALVGLCALYEAFKMMKSRAA